LGGDGRPEEERLQGESDGEDQSGALPERHADTDEQAVHHEVDADDQDEAQREGPAVTRIRVSSRLGLEALHEQQQPTPRAKPSAGMP
jgi:hypothetical protein